MDVRIPSLLRIKPNALYKLGKYLRKNGFVILDRLKHLRYDGAYHAIHTSELPVYISIDSVMHAVFASHDEIMADLERKRVHPQLSAIVSAMRCALPAMKWPIRNRWLLSANQATNAAGAWS